MRTLGILSPTWALSDNLTRTHDKANTIEALNSVYLWIAIVCTVSIGVYQQLVGPSAAVGLYAFLPYPVLILWSYFLLSRCNEIFYSFLRDAFDKLEPDKVESTLPDKSDASILNFRDRIRLSLKSYLELIMNFAILYVLTDKSLWKTDNAPTLITDAIYFSCITITTTGYGDISPSHWYPQFLSVYEVFCGVLLLVVCFSIYAGKLDRTSG